MSEPKIKTKTNYIVSMASTLLKQPDTNTQAANTSEPEIKTENEDHVESSVRQVVYLEPSISVLKAMVKEKHEARDRSPVRRRLFPPVQEVQKQREWALTQEKKRADIAKTARVIEQEAEVKEWIETKYAQGKPGYFTPNDGATIEFEVLVQLEEEGYIVEQQGGTIVFQSK